MPIFSMTYEAYIKATNQDSKSDLIILLYLATIIQAI
jgi:hypothetical protein